MDNTFIIPLVRDDLIERCLETLYRYTPPNFYVYLIDQTPNGIDAESYRKRYENLMVIRTPRTKTHHAGNLGFAKATNLGISLVETPYFTMCNDDVEFINRAWWWGVLESFDIVDKQTPDRPCLTVTPASFKLPDWSVGRPSGDDFYILPYKNKYSQEDWDFLVNEDHYVNEHLTIKPGAVIDGITFYCSVFKTREFLKTGMLDERYYSGGAEDYDYCCRAYMNNYRAVGTTLSWVYHHWSSTLSSKDPELAQKIADTKDQKLLFGDHNEIWGYKQDENGEFALKEDGTKIPLFDLWGVKCKECDNPLRTRENNVSLAVCKDHPNQTFQIPEPTITPL